MLIALIASRSPRKKLGVAPGIANFGNVNAGVLPPEIRFSKGLLSFLAAPQVAGARRNRPVGRRLDHGCRKPEDRIVTLLKWALIFFLVSIVAGILGFTGLSAATADIARFLFYVFVVIFLVLLILGLTIFRV